MIGLTGLVDTQLASKLSQRLDLLALKAEVQIDGPGPVIQVEKVVNNVGLFSRAALSAALIPRLSTPCYSRQFYHHIHESQVIQQFAGANPNSLSKNHLLPVEKPGRC